MDTLERKGMDGKMRLPHTHAIICAIRVNVTGSLGPCVRTSAVHWRPLDPMTMICRVHPI